MKAFELLKSSWKEESNRTLSAADPIRDHDCIVFSYFNRRNIFSSALPPYD